MYSSIIKKDMVKKIGILISAFRRPIETRQAIFSALNQSYEDKKVFVAVKGYSEDYYNLLFPDEFSSWIEKGELVLKYCNNKNQISNTLDCVRDEDLSDIDYFVKMDNDDVYLKDYVRNIVEFLNKEQEKKNFPDGVGTHYSIYLRSSNGHDRFSEVFKDYYQGNQLAFSPAVLQRLFDIESKKEDGVKDLDIKLSDYTNFIDDKLIVAICQALGGMVERGIFSDSIYNESNNSCYRNTCGFLGKSREYNLPIPEALEMGEGEVIHVHHPYWEACFSINGDRFSKDDGDSGVIVSRTPESIIVKWDRWGKESFEKQEGGYWLYSGDVDSE